jgi:glutathione S-transferase
MHPDSGYTLPMVDMPQSEGRRILWGAGTPRTLRAHWMLQELGLAYERRPIGSRSGETHTAAFTAINPSRKIPVLEDGGFVLSESAAIVSYLSEAYGAGNGLALPAGARERARYYQWCFFVMMELDANTLYVIRRHLDLKGVYGEAPNAIHAARECFEQQAWAAAERLSGSRGPYALGERFSGVDVLLATALAGAQRRDIPLPAILQEYLKRVTGRDAYRRAVDLNQPVTSERAA